MDVVNVPPFVPSIELKEMYKVTAFVKLINNKSLSLNKFNKVVGNK